MLTVKLKNVYVDHTQYKQKGTLHSSASIAQVASH